MSKFSVKGKIFPVIVWLGLLTWVLVLLVLLGWGALTSVKSVLDFYHNPVWLPKKEYGGWLWNNYAVAFKAIHVTKNGVPLGVPILLRNSLLFAIGNAFFSVLTACIASYVLAKYNYIGWVKGLWLIVLIQNYMPISSSLAGNIKFLHMLGLYDSMIGNWLWSCGAFGALFLLYYATWKGVSWSYAEAAFIDGASHFKTMVMIMWPMTATIFGVLCLTQFISLWNDYMTPLYYLPSYPSMAYGAWLFQFNIDEPDVAVAPIQIAGLYILALPVLMIFLVFRNKLMGSLTMGGLKG